ncbi:MAG: agmatine deiminase [Desulfobacterales bacterium]|nr:agmatine deiminase [Desulfobacterales bacterium]
MSEIIDSTPKIEGYRMPAEFEPHKQTWMLWPYRSDLWRNGGKPVQRTFIKLAETISQFEPVTVGVSQNQYLAARSKLPNNIRVVEMSYNDIWVRDSGPTFVVNDRGNVRGIDWGFNAWGGLNGGLYWPWDLDNLVPQKILEIENIDRYKPENFILEGGSIHVDGQGTLLTTEECLLHPNRNPHLNKTQVEELLKEYVNVEKIIWLKKGNYEDCTYGHVDILSAFIRPGVVVLHWTDDKSDPQYEISADAYERLTNATDAKGRKLEVHKIHGPTVSYVTREEAEGIDVLEGSLPLTEGMRLDQSYINFYMANGCAIVPTFNDPQDKEALEKLQKLMPERKVIGINGREVVIPGGIFHCITQQQPLGIRQNLI